MTRNDNDLVERSEKSREVSQELLWAFVVVAFVLEGRKAPELLDQLRSMIHQVARELLPGDKSIKPELGITRQTLSNWGHLPRPTAGTGLAVILTLAGMAPEQPADQAEVDEAMQRLTYLELINPKEAHALTATGVALQRQLATSLEGVLSYFPSIVALAERAGVAPSRE